MIVRISGDGQYRIDDRVLNRLNVVDDLLEDALQSDDQDRFSRELGTLLALVREAGERLDTRHLAESDLILPPEDISMAELELEMSRDGLVPG